MASLTRQKGKYYRVFWNFKVAAGPKAGQTIQGSAYLGSCTRAAAKPSWRTSARSSDSWQSKRSLPTTCSID